MTRDVIEIQKMESDDCGLGWLRKGGIKEAGPENQAGGSTLCWVSGILTVLSNLRAPGDMAVAQPH